MSEFFTEKVIPWINNLFPSVVRVIVTVILAAAITTLAGKIIRKLWKKTKVDESAQHYVIVTVKILIWIMAVIICLDLLGFPIGSVLTVIAAVGAAIALAIKDNLANLASGVVLLFTKPFKAGDFIEVGNISGTIRSIELMHTYIDTVTNTLAAVPNNTMMAETIINYSAHDLRRQDLMFSIGYNDDMFKAKELLLRLAEENEKILNKPETPIVGVWEHGASAIVLMLRFWCARQDYFSVRFELNEQVKVVFNEEGITMPYPHISVVTEN